MWREKDLLHPLTIGRRFYYSFEEIDRFIGVRCLNFVTPPTTRQLLAGEIMLGSTALVARQLGMTSKSVIRAVWHGRVAAVQLAGHLWRVDLSIVGRRQLGIIDDL